eukprot:23426_4
MYLRDAEKDIQHSRQRRCSVDTREEVFSYTRSIASGIFCAEEIFVRISKGGGGRWRYFGICRGSDSRVLVFQSPS